MNGDFEQDQKDKLLRLKISETLILGFDAGNNPDNTVLQVARSNGATLTVLNTFRGEEAEWLYGMLLSNHICHENFSKAESGVLEKAMTCAPKTINPEESYQRYIEHYAKNHGMTLTQARQSPMCQAYLNVLQNGFAFEKEMIKTFEQDFRRKNNASNEEESY